MIKEYYNSYHPDSNIQIVFSVILSRVQTYLNFVSCRFPGRSGCCSGLAKFLFVPLLYIRPAKCLKPSRPTLCLSVFKKNVKVEKKIQLWNDTVWVSLKLKTSFTFFLLVSSSKGLCGELQCPDCWHCRPGAWEVPWRGKDDPWCSYCDWCSW